VSKIRQSWNAIAGHYAWCYPISTKVVHYGPLCPGEDKLGLLADLAGKHVLELGCGAGQNSVALARAGAIVTAVDFSDAQIEQARAASIKNGTEITFAVADVCDLSRYRTESFDVAISACTIAFVEDIKKAFTEACRVIRPGGLFILSDMHPLQYIVDETSKGMRFNHAYPFKPFAMKWSWDFSGSEKWKAISAPFKHYVRSISDYHNALTESGFEVERILEPKPTLKTPHIGFSREIIREYKYIASHLPITFIMVCMKA
jgi:ubiquinone/menaquinone biosynthesis C-methylase UbiE